MVSSDLTRPGRRVDPSVAAFCGLLAVTAAFTLVETRGMSFYGDDWDFVVDRPGLSAHVLFTPHGPHLSVVPILIYKVLLAVFGARSYLPFQCLTALDLVLMVAAVGHAARLRWGAWWGLAPAFLLLTLGQASYSTLWSFQSGYALATSFGLGALLCVHRARRTTDVLACLALIVALGSGSQGIGFSLGAALLLAMRRSWRRAWVVVIPLVLYTVWYLKYGHLYSETHLGLWPTALPYAMQSLSATLGPLCGLSTVAANTGVIDTTYGVPMAVAAVAGIGAGIWRGWRPSPLFWSVALTAVVLWFASAVSNTPMYPRAADTSRYLSTNALLVLVCGVAALPRPALTRQGCLIVGVILLVIGATNAEQYSESRDGFLRSDRVSRAELGALALMHGVVPATFTPSLPGDPSVLIGVDSANFFATNRDHGLEFDSVAQLTTDPEATRETIDHELVRGELTLAAAHRVNASARPPQVVAGSPTVAGGCLIIGSGSAAVRAEPGRYELEAGAAQSLTVAAGRFASVDSVPLGMVPAGGVSAVTVPSDGAPHVPWQIALSGADGRICAVASQP